MKRLLLLLVPALVVAFFAMACGGDDDDASPTATPTTAATGATGPTGPTGTPAASPTPDDDETLVRIGALLPLSGALASYGEASEAALEAARDAINDESDLQVELVVRNTETNPDKALEMLEDLHEEGIRIVVGPYASSEVAAVRDFADQNGIIILSPLSTATTLAIANDNVFRFTPDDEAEGIAVAAVAIDDGITTVIPLSRNDPGNLGLQSGMRAEFEGDGRSFVEGVTYGTSDVDFADVVEQLIAILEANEAAASETAVYLTAFGEVVDLFNAASENGSEVLTSVPWYGSDSVALSRELVEDSTAAAFAVEIGYPNPILGLRDQDSSLWQPVVDQLQSELGRTPDSFALAAYDALVVAHMALEAAGEDATDAELRDAIVAAAADTTGLTGPLVLNDAGDRDSGSYDFWSVCPDGDSFTWTRTISFVPGTNGGEATVQRYGC